jgi:hypothetical protein
MRLRSQPKSESLVWLQHLELLLKDWEPGSDKMKVLEADPLTLLGGLLDLLNGNLILTTTHGNSMETSSSNNLVSEFLKLSTWIRSSGYDEQDRLTRRRFHLEKMRESEWRRLNSLPSKCLFHKVVHC